MPSALALNGQPNAQYSFYAQTGSSHGFALVDRLHYVALIRREW